MSRRISGIFYALLFLAAFSLVPQAQETLTNGDLHTGTISVAGETDSWTFTASAGNGVMVRIGGTNFPPRLRVFDPANALVGEVTSGNLSTRDVFLSVVATNAGTYTVLASSATAATGAYGLNLAIASGSFNTSPGDEGGGLQSGANNPGTISLGDLDLWSFTAAAGDAVMLRMGGTLPPWIRLYGPNGAIVDEVLSGNFNTRDVVLTTTATNAGTYLVVASGTFSGGMGAYTLHLAQAPATVVVTPGDEGGELVNGAKASGEITVGDLDVWRFTANAGDSLSLRMGGTLTPWIRLYGPDGALVANALSGNFNIRDVLATAVATNTGTYVAVASSTFAGVVGAYDLTLAKVPADFIVTPGDEGGDLTNGVDNAATITLGDLDMWRFTAAAGDELMVRMGGTFPPLIRLYATDGKLVAEGASGNFNVRDVVVTAKATNAGTYVVVASGTFAGAIGDYNLHLAQAPGEFQVSTNDQGGELQSGGDHEGTITLGDLDLWSFTAQAGDGVMLRMGAEFAPWIRLYGPNGALVGNVSSGNFNIRDVVLTAVATNAGTYTVVASGTFSGAIGDYNLHLALGLGEVIVPPGDEGGLLVNGATNNATINLGDLDVWSFTGTVGDSNVFRVTATNFAPWIRLYGPTGALVAESAPGNFNVRSANLIYELTTNPGTYTVVISSGFSGMIGTYAFKQSRWAPDLNVPQNAVIAEGEPLNVSISAQDPDEQVKPLQFELVSAPPSAIFALGGPTNATISMATTEADGPVTNLFVAVVTDVVNGRTFKRTNSFSVVVQEINLAPQLTVPNDVTINELSPLNVTPSATDADIPANPLTFSLQSAPEGMTINAGSGAISWTPSEVQGPSTNVITVVVTDESPFAANEKNLGATNTFTVIVREVNTAPVLSVPGAQTLNEGTAFSIAVSATDADLPVNSRAFALLTPPPGMAINPTTGEISWTPTEAQGPSTNTVTVVATDSSPLAVNATQLSTTNSFVVTVREVNTVPQLTVPADQTVNELASINVSAVATDTDQPTNAWTFTLPAPPAGMTIDAATGAISWTPTEEQGPSTNVISVVATDSSPLAVNAQSLSVTNRFTILVNELNTAPTLPAQNDRTIDEGSPLGINNAAIDTDLPANTLRYTLVAGPTNAAISANGTITWTPTEAHGSTTNVFTTVVSDNATPSQSATNTFIVIVNETNTAPVVEAITQQSVRYGLPLTLRVIASDPDTPTNILSFTKEQGPTNLTVNATTGEISWTPVQSEVGSHTVTIRVNDNGTPTMSTAVTFQILATGEETRLQIARSQAGSMQITIDGNSGVSYELQRSTDLRAWEREFEFRMNTSPFVYTVLNWESKTNRFYRLRTGP